MRAAFAALATLPALALGTYFWGCMDVTAQLFFPSPNSDDSDHWPQFQPVLVGTWSLVDSEYILQSLSLGPLNRVQGSSNTITWTYTQGDPTPISIFIVNSDVNTLNGAFSVDEYVDVATQVPTRSFISKEVS